MTISSVGPRYPWGLFWLVPVLPIVTFALLLGATQLTAVENLPASSSSAAQPHYLDRYKPVAIWTLDQAPTSDNLSDTSGQLKATVHGDNEKGLPKHVDGARDFLGKAWDFNGVPTSFRSEATGRLQTLGDMERTKGISVSFWMKAPIERLQRLISDETDDRTRSNTFRLMALLFPVEPRPAGTQAEAAERLNLPLNYLCPDKGYSNMRSSWDDDAVNLVFRCQHDKYNVGHGHPDINSFELYANGTTWFPDPGKFQHFSDCHQTILIDGKGPSGSSWAHTWPPMPGRFVEFSESDRMVYGVGDAKTTYDYSVGGSNNRSVKLEKIPAEEVDLIWADFAYGKTREDLPSMASWRALPLAKLLHADGKHLYRYNPVRRAFRTAALVRGKHPYTLIVDDYQKDDQPHQYDWIGNFAVGTVEVVSQSGSDLIVQKKGEADIGNRLLVRVIQADGLSGAPELVNTVIGAIPGNPNTGKAVTQVRVTARDVVAPNFKVLLYPFSKGTSLPRTEFAANALQVEFEAQKDSFAFKTEADGRTRILEH